MLDKREMSRAICIPCFMHFN